MLSNTSELLKGLPPVATLYHYKAVPVATSEFTVAPEQKNWSEAVGACAKTRALKPESKNIKEIKRRVLTSFFFIND